MRKYLSLTISIIIIISVFTGAQLMAFAQEDTVNVEVQMQFGQSEARKMLNMVNDLRKPENAWYYNENNQKIWQQNLQPLVYDYELEKVAMQRAAEIAFYFSHTRPNGKNCFDAYSMNYSSAGENIAYGYETAEEVFVAWSEEFESFEYQGHRRNMLDSGFAAIGIGHAVYNGAHFWVQEFIYPAASVTPTAALDGNMTVNVQLSKAIVGDDIINSIFSNLGDANGDGIVSAIDARIVLRIAIKLDSIEKYGIDKSVIDINSDGKITSVDARLTLRIALRINE